MLPKSRILPCLLAGAAGDCIGGPYEGSTRVFSVASLNQPWAISDDTVLTLATCQAIANTHKVDPASIAAEFVLVLKQRRVTNLGASTFKALQELAAGKHWSLTGAVGEYSAGNGVAMRIAPLAFFLNPWDERDRVNIRDVARITHRHDESYIGALAIIYAMQMLHESGIGAFRSPQDFIERLAGLLPDTAVRDSLMKLAALPDNANYFDAARVSGTSGFVAHSVPLAIYLAVLFYADLSEAILSAVKCGGDTDTTAAMVGYILGAQGHELPMEWRNKIPIQSEIISLSALLSQSIVEDRS